jgi:hypothetical protein
MQRCMRRLYPLACGGITLGVLQAIGAIDFNQIWFDLLYVVLNTLVSLLLGGDLSTVSATGSLFESLFV